MSRKFGPLAILIVVLLVVFASSGFMRVVDAGEACAVTTFGDITGVAGPGFHLRLPLAQHFNCFSTRALVYEASKEPGESDADFTDVIVDAQTSDGQSVTVTFSVRYYVPQGSVMDVYRQVGENMALVNERVVKFHSRSVVRLTMQKYPAQQLYSGDVFKVETDISERLNTLFGVKWVVLDSFSLRKIAFDDNYVGAISQQQIAQVQIETARFQAEAAKYEAEKNVELAKGDAQAEVERAKGDAQAEIERARGDALAIEERGKALDKHPRILQLEFINQLTGVSWGILPSEGLTPLIALPTPPAVPNP
jgi:regulator of protease activity HflC (stomatin/prohibitin superfamily)